MADRRLELKKEEERLISEIDNQSEVLEQKAEKVIKTSLIVSASVLAGYVLYSFLSDEKPSKKKKKKKNRPVLLDNPMVNSLIQSMVKKGIEMIVSDKIVKK